MDTTQKILGILAILCFAALILMGACGCTVSHVDVDARTWQIGVGHHYQRSTDITADDSDTADVQTDADVGLSLPIIRQVPQGYHVQLPNGGATVPTLAEAEEIVRLARANGQLLRNPE